MSSSPWQMVSLKSAHASACCSLLLQHFPRAGMGGASSALAAMERLQKSAQPVSLVRSA